MGISYFEARKFLLRRYGGSDEVTDVMIRLLMAEVDKAQYDKRHPSKCRKPKIKQRVILPKVNDSRSRCRPQEQLPSGKASGSLSPAPRKARVPGGYRGKQFGVVVSRKFGDRYKRPPMTAPE